MYNALMRRLCSGRGLHFFDTFEPTVSAVSFDGLHYGGCSRERCEDSMWYTLYTRNMATNAAIGSVQCINIAAEKMFVCVLPVAGGTAAPVEMTCMCLPHTHQS